MANLATDIQSVQSKSLLSCVIQVRISNDSNWNAPLEPKLVKLPCPGSKCSSDNSVYLWICPDCKETLFYDEKILFFYCNCGRFKVSDAVFKCENPAHGPGYAPPADQTQLLALLRKLDPAEQYNILILGETGIGKSMFINAFVNYMLYASLEDAIKDPSPLKWAVPFEFNYDERNDRNIITESVRIVVGSQTEYEKYPIGGRTATQTCVTYVLNMRGRIVRLIDTPGFGDTRGPAQDSENVNDILKTLESVGKLSTIMYFMKPDISRLTPTFEFCLIELLSRLHKNTVQNIVFGFTRARRSNFAVQGTREVLEMLLRKHKVTMQSLDDRKMFFFDSESFLYLAAWKQKQKKMGDVADYAKMWKRSAEEARRLVTITMGLPTHEVKETLSLNRTRNTVIGLPKPMVAITEGQRITRNDIKDQTDNIERYQREGQAMTDLRKRQVAKRKTYAKPRTVCASPDCQKNFNGIIVYPRLCHEDCDCVDVPDGVIGVPALAKCKAINPANSQCSDCDHSWKTHLHVSYSMNWEWETYTDEDATRKKQQNKAAQEKAQGLLKTANDKLKAIENEDKIARESLATLRGYLDQYALVAYNDVTPSYLAMLIENANRSGTDQARADAQRFQEQKETYEKQTIAIKQAVENRSGTRPDESAVVQAMEKLATLKYAGPEMSQIVASPTKLDQPKSRSVRVDLKSSSTMNYDWMVAKVL